MAANEYDDSTLYTCVPMLRSREKVSNVHKEPSHRQDDFVPPCLSTANSLYTMRRQLSPQLLVLCKWHLCMRYEKHSHSMLVGHPFVKTLLPAASRTGGSGAIHVALFSVRRSASLSGIQLEERVVQMCAGSLTHLASLRCGYSSLLGADVRL